MLISFLDSKKGKERLNSCPHDSCSGPPSSQAIGRDEAGIIDVFCISDLLSSGAAERQAAIAAIAIEAEVPHAGPIRLRMTIHCLTETQVCDAWVV